jgi:hypothetical protein
MILMQARESELKDARRFFRSHSRLPMNSLPELGGQPVLQLYAETDVDVHSIFNQTKVLPRPLGNPADEEETEMLGHQATYQEQHPVDGYPGERQRDDWPQDAYSAESRHGEGRPAEPQPDPRYADTGDLPLVHQDLRDMQDAGVPAGSDDHGGGIPLLWEDE